MTFDDGNLPALARLAKRSLPARTFPRPLAERSQRVCRVPWSDRAPYPVVKLLSSRYAARWRRNSANGERASRSYGDLDENNKRQILAETRLLSEAG